MKDMLAWCYLCLNDSYLPFILRVTVMTFNDIVESVMLLNDDAYKTEMKIYINNKQYNSQLHSNIGSKVKFWVEEPKPILSGSVDGQSMSVW